MQSTSSMLKTNFETFSLIWFDKNANITKDYIDIQQELRSIIHHIKTFERREECEQYIQQAVEECIILVINEQLGQDIVPSIHDLRQITAIYMYCSNGEYVERWASKYSKIKIVVTQLNDLVTQIRATQRRREKIEEPLRISIVDRSSTEIDGDFLHSQLFLHVLGRMDPIPSEKNELTEFCQILYNDNPFELRLIKEFAQDYCKEKALWWYTRECFVYRMLNKAFRSGNDDLLLLFRFLIRDIQEQLTEEQILSPIRVFRSQLMSEEELSILHRSIDKFIAVNSFFSTSMDRTYTLFLLDSGTNNGMRRILFEIVADPHLTNVKPFADITSYSQFPDEKEVLFMAGSVFRVNHINEENGINIIYLTLVSEEEHDLKHLFDRIKREIGKKYDLYTLANVLQRSGKLDTAEKCVRRYLKALPDNHRHFSLCYHMLGGILIDRNQYDEAVAMLNKALEIYEKTLRANNPVFGNIYNSIGIAYHGKGDLQRALDWYEKALSIDQRVFGQEHERVATCLYNIGLIYYNEGNCNQALSYFQEALVIQEKLLPINHPDLADSHNNIGKVYEDLKQFDLAIERYEIALKISLKSLPSDHPHLAITYKNIAHIYEEKANYRQAVIQYEKAHTIYSKIFPANHSKIIETEEDIARIKTRLK